MTRETVVFTGVKAPIYPTPYKLFFSPPTIGSQFHRDKKPVKLFLNVGPHDFCVFLLTFCAENGASCTLSHPLVHTCFPFMLKKKCAGNGDRAIFLLMRSLCSIECFLM